MGLLARAVFREIIAGAAVGTFLFTFVLFLRSANLLFEQLVRGSAPPATVGYLFLLVMPFVLMFTIPVGVLVGVMIGLSRMSSDGEIIALRAAGVSTRRLLGPVVGFALLGTAITAACSIWINPWAVRETVRILNEIAAEQMTAEIQPRVFAEQFPNKTLYVGDVLSGPVIRWRNVFIADMTPPEQRKRSTQEASSDAPRITIATDALAVPDSVHNSIQLRLLNGSTHEVGKDLERYFTTRFPSLDQLLEAKPPEEQRAKAYTGMDTQPLREEAKKSRDADIELQRRFSLPPACLLLALVGLPLGVSSRKSGKSAAFVTTVFLSFLYFMAQVSLIGLAKQGRMEPMTAAWAPNVAFALIGLILLVRLETPGDSDLIGRVRSWFGEVVHGITSRFQRRETAKTKRLELSSPFGGFPQLIDTYLLGTFFFYLAVWLASFVLLIQVFTFFELLSDILRNNIPMSRVATYHLFLTPKLIYDSAPISVMVAVLITFAVLSKQNEVTAFKASGVSLYRLSLPILLASLGISGALFAFDYYVVPDANLIQDGIRNEIKGRAVRTFLRPDRQWIYGKGSRIFHYKYFDPASRVMGGVHIYELDPKVFKLKRHIHAERAQWDPGMATWIFQNGWSRNADNVKDYQVWQVTTFPELIETPDHFLPEEKQYKQLNFHQLANYIAELGQSGFDTVSLRVQYQRKFSVPLFPFILAIIAVPFSFWVGNRGAMTAVGASFVIAIAYLTVNQLFEQVGNLDQLPATVAAWSPNVIFTLAGLYAMTRMRS
ncbi:MAG TPA: LptF/LptG family permease [Bryobacteraceae bacterium]|nr:LptF/LptG family permease [Bryobacteraceae bacterium]